MARNPIRDTVKGNLDQDRLWILNTPEGKFAITEYNDELMGFHPRLAEIDPKIFHYGGNAYYILNKYSKEHGWSVEECEDRK